MDTPEGALERCKVKEKGCGCFDSGEKSGKKSGVEGRVKTEEQREVGEKIPQNRPNSLNSIILLSLVHSFILLSTNTPQELILFQPRVINWLSDDNRSSRFSR